MKLKSILIIPLALLLAGCGNGPANYSPEPVDVGAAVTLTASGDRENPFTGRKTPYQINADFTVDLVTLFRHPQIAPQGSIIMLMVSVKNSSNEPLMLQRPDFSLITDSGKVYNAGVRPGRPWVNEARDLGPDMSMQLLVAFKIPYHGLTETTCFAIGGMKLVRITDANISDTSNWLVCDKASLVKSTYSEFFH